MKKQVILLVLVFVLCISFTSYAAPVVDIEKGNFIFDYSQNSFNVDSNLSGIYSFSNDDVKFSNINFGYGITDKTAIIIGRQKLNTLTTIADNGFYTEAAIFDIEALDIKVQQKLNNNLAAYIGTKKFTEDVAYVAIDNYTGDILDYYEGSNNNNKAQFGLIYNKDIGEKIKGFALIGIGKGLIEYEIGAGYKFNKNTMIDINYKSIDVDLGADDSFNVKGKGVGFGLSAKF